MLILALFGGTLLLFQTPIEEIEQSQERTRIAPASGGVELEGIDIQRRAARGAVKEADLTNMEIELWFGAEWKHEDISSPALVQFESLNPIEDDKGEILSTERRLKNIKFLEGEVRVGHWQSSKGKGGPMISLLFDAPSRGAEKLKAIKGKAQVTLTKTVDLTFEDLEAINGKQLDHPDMKSLADMKLRFAIEEEGGEITAKVGSQVNSPLGGKKQQFREPLEPRPTERLGAIKRGQKIRILEAIETFEFDFQDVPLP